jgi:hypothetical protein
MTSVDVWNWRMNYCKENGLPPAQNWAWDVSGKAFINSQINIMSHFIDSLKEMESEKSFLEAIEELKRITETLFAFVKEKDCYDNGRISVEEK